MSCHTSRSKQHALSSTCVAQKRADAMDTSERGNIVHVNLKPQSHCSDCEENPSKKFFLKCSLMHSQAYNASYTLESAYVLLFAMGWHDPLWLV